MGKRWARAASLLLALSPAACGAGDDPANETTASTAEAVDLTQPISVRFISIAGATCSAMSTSDANKAIEIINKAGGISGLKFRLWRHDVYTLPKDLRTDLVTWDDLRPLWYPMGISVAKGRELVANVEASWPATERYLFRWLNRYRTMLMPNQVVAWQGCAGGVEMSTGAFISGKANFAHEMGHGFNLSHSFSMSLNCGAWDLIYAARGRGQSNVYFTSQADCELFQQNNSGYSFYRVDPRNEDAQSGQQRSFTNGLATVQHPRCSTCGVGVGLSDPPDNGVERYSTGAPQVNAMTYCPSGCPNGNLVGRHFYSASQIDRMKQWAAQESWVFSQGAPVPFNPPSQSCGYVDPNEGLQRDQPLYSCDGRFRLYLQADGNLVLSMKGSNGQFSTVLWKTNPLVAGTDTTDIRLIMQADGNLVVYDSRPTALWHTATHGHPGAYVKLGNDGNLAVRSASTTYWKTNTGGH
jgi:hypothetical protein